MKLTKTGGSGNVVNLKVVRDAPIAKYLVSLESDAGAHDALNLGQAVSQYQGVKTPLCPL